MDEEKLKKAYKKGETWFDRFLILIGTGCEKLAASSASLAIAIAVISVFLIWWLTR